MQIKTRTLAKAACWMTITAAAIMLIAPAANAFSGESAAVNELMDFLLKKDFKRMGDGLVYDLMTICQRQFINLLLLNPNPMSPGVLSITKYFIALLGPIFVLATVASGIYMIFFSGSPNIRSRIKAILPGVIAAMLLVMLSPHILNALFFLSEELFTGIISQGPRNAMGILLPDKAEINPINYFMSKFDRITWYSGEGSAPFLFISLLIVIGLLMVVIARYLLISLFVMIFPLTIFLYLFIPTRRMGKRLMEQTLVWIFLQVIEAITLVSVVTIVTIFAPFLVQEILILLDLGALIALVVIPAAAVFFFRDFLPG
jgi:hypothetical protein